ncbi:hypothetical protein FGIG_06739 [Fasciola gigantica]|uniref:Uncharacterized protein n=1 Tax=Fasciola gigantica TaxID=46835 RepID=A0A504ZAH3_FASGI|nr:hypothetical protein FGIG_06739 [Fasciola gigantica]
MQSIHQSFTVLLLCLIIFESALANRCGTCGGNQQDESDSSLFNTTPEQQSHRYTPSRTRKLYFELTDELDLWLRTNMANSICSTPNNLFLVRVNSTLSYRRYNTQVT